MKTSYYETQPPSKMMQLFWKAAGADKFILERATYSDQIKYTCLGGIIVATGVMAALAGGYAFYTIFEPKNSALDDSLDGLTCVISIFFGILWGLMIFNLDRFIVSSTGKGDGTEAITWDELKGALPRIVMGAIIAMTISKPVEIRMFKTEIDVELHKEQMAKQQEYLSNIESIYAGRISTEKQKLEKLENAIQVKEARYVQLENLLADEMGGKRGTAGMGPEARKLDEQLKRLDNEIRKIKVTNEPLITSSYYNIRNFEKEKQKEIENSEVVANKLDGLLERIKLAHKIAGTMISLFITLLFMAIELTPIFFKLMLTKTPYDYLEENIKEMMKAERGILVDYNYYQDKQGQERDLVVHFEKEKITSEKKELLEVQKRLTAYALQKYEEGMKAKIDQNPEAFISIQDESANPN